MALQQEHQRGMESRLKQARLPWVKTLEQFDFTFQPGTIVRLPGDWLVWRSWSAAETRSCWGLQVSEKPSGHRSWCESGGCRASGTVHCTGQTDRDTDESETGNRLERQLQQLSYARVLILDEISYLRMIRE